MAIEMATKLNAALCRNQRHSGKSKKIESYGDGNGLMLAISPSGSKRWIQRLVIRGTRRTFTLGRYPNLSLGEARSLALKNRNIARDGGDPLRGDVPDFRMAAETVIELRSAAWRPGSKSAKQWRASLAAYAYPVLGEMPVNKITSADVLAAIAPIWNKKRETAQRVRQRISTVMLYCVAQGHCQNDPAGKAVLQALPSGTGRVRNHFPALHYRDVPAALQRIQRTDAWIGTRLAFAFLVHTATRSGEVRSATWSEINLAERLWTIPPERMKAKIRHRVPLSNGSLAILASAKAITDPPMFGHLAGCRLVFPAFRGRPMSDSTMSKLCREHDVGAVPHGFRSSFRDWAGECTDTPYEVMEAALAHTVRSKTIAAYARSDLLDKRRSLMERWSEFVLGEGEGEK